MSKDDEVTVVERRVTKNDRRQTDSDRRGDHRVVTQATPRRQKTDRRKPQ